MKFPIVLLIIYTVINLIIFIMYAVDKIKAKNHSSRIPENTLIIASIFGIAGANLAIVLLNHKVKKLKFQIFIPIITLVELFLFIVIKGVFFS